QIPDQMYLSDQLQRFIDGLPVGELLAIYLHAGISSVLVQSFTSDHAQLLAAVHKSMPHLLPTGSEYLSDWNTLHQIAMDLSQVPGRKNILWFSGGSTLFLRPDASLMPVSGDMRRIYDELETGRIAVYPIDARGLMTYQSGNVWAQHQMMNDVAEATGGQASYNTNGIWQAAKHVTDSGHSFYTVTYSPHGFHYDNKWHKVRIGVEGAKYNLSYRRGYFGDGSHDDTPKGAARSRLLAEGKTALEQPEFRSAPIIFSAKVKAVVPFAERSAAVDLVPVRKGETRYSIWYSLPVAAFTRQTMSQQPQVMLGVGVLAMNRDGSRLASLAQKITVTVDEDKLRLAPDSPLPVVQTIDLRQGDVYLYLAVWDMVSRRLGTLQIPLHVPAAGAAHSTKETN
ncbi:MAG TPA: VWA domain-containing protein, partial [Edaphobacter sp.]|nr:VWA domain-containing protein [Edaphobacter sp.]